MLKMVANKEITVIKEETKMEKRIAEITTNIKSFSTELYHKSEVLKLYS